MPKRQVTAIDLDQVSSAIDRFDSFWYSLGVTALPMTSHYPSHYPHFVHFYKKRTCRLYEGTLGSVILYPLTRLLSTRW